MVVMREGAMPPSGFDGETTDGLLRFLRGCYRQMKAEVASGKHANVQAAIEHEIEVIGRALEKLHIEPDGTINEKT